MSKQEKYSHQALVDIAEICAIKNVTHWVISPGSRSAPLTLAFARHPKIKTFVVADERSAGFIALGMAQNLGQTVGLICSSGTALLNYAPALAEGFYQQTPLLVLTADRPPEWVNQQDGQTINQVNVYQNFIKKSESLPLDYENKNTIWHIQRIVSEAINCASSFPKGGIHINIPIREPFYPTKETVWKYSSDIKIITELPTHQVLGSAVWKDLVSTFSASEKVLIVGGQNSKDKELIAVLNSFRLPIIADIISNLDEVENAIKYQDIFLGNCSADDKIALQPDLLITFGKSVISKNLKLFLRKNPPKAHWHIQEAGDVADTFQSLTKIIRVSPLYFFERLKEKVKVDFLNFDYLKSWQKKDQIIKDKNQHFFEKQTFSEFETVAKVLGQLPDNCNLHLANSMSVRYANFVNLWEKKNIEVFSNRGASGIDGCTSTAVGHCFVSEKLNFLITGDVAFFYDNNAFWNKYPKNNLRILLLNNRGGGIFRMLPDAARQTELSDYFETQQPLEAKMISEQYDFDYFKIETKEQLLKLLPLWLENSGKAKILEVITDKAENTKVLENYKLREK